MLLVVPSHVLNADNPGEPNFLLVLLLGDVLLKGMPQPPGASHARASPSFSFLNYLQRQFVSFPLNLTVLAAAS